jgi:hypothetical protein
VCPERGILLVVASHGFGACIERDAQIGNAVGRIVACSAAAARLIVRERARARRAREQLPELVHPSAPLVSRNCRIAGLQDCRKERQEGEPVPFLVCNPAIRQSCNSPATR